MPIGKEKFRFFSKPVCSLLNAYPGFFWETLYSLGLSLKTASLVFLFVLRGSVNSEQFSIEIILGI